MRRAAKRDQNEPDIVAALEAIGASVQRLNEPGVPDLLVSFRGVLFLVEVKLPITKAGRAKSRGGGSELTPAQREWWLRWKGTAPVIVHSMDEALRAVGARVG